MNNEHRPEPEESHSFFLFLFFSGLFILFVFFFQNISDYHRFKWGSQKPDDFCSSTRLLEVSVIVKTVRVQVGSGLCLSVKEEYVLSWKYLKIKKERKALKMLNNWVKEIMPSSQ